MSPQAAEPSDVSLVLDFLNTVDVEHDTDVLRTAESWRAWAEQRGRTADPLAPARQARDALRAAVGDPDLPADPAGASVRVELRAGAPELVAGTVVGAVLAAAARLAVLGQWERVKICPADDCRCAFFDQSRNRSRTWCSMRLCGNREKARSWRERAARAGD
ncbi:CGNR zinc finger domain-containing protein [Amycolatopsis aidingensis]|uniref:CGNR zinc finger domain-containing protein n=1 Tax=Amycolatopsis aidingensis TaxID=2842453 RepID=UPI001C0E4B7B|nr:CGNR zinc finger domain-containing protein [Amycolatopsis aidingensis]